MYFNEENYFIYMLKIVINVLRRIKRLCLIEFG